MIIDPTEALNVASAVIVVVLALAGVFAVLLGLASYVTDETPNQRRYRRYCERYTAELRRDP